MKISELVKQGVERIRLPEWETGGICYLKLHFEDPETIGPWGYLYEPELQAAIGVETPQTIFLIGMVEERFAPYEGELCEEQE